MWYIFILLSQISGIEADNSAERLLQSSLNVTRGDLGPFRLKFQFIPDEFGNLPDPSYKEHLDGVAYYLSKALSVYQVTSGIAIPNCFGQNIPLTLDADFVILVRYNKTIRANAEGFTCANQINGRENALAGIIEIRDFENFYSTSYKVPYYMLFLRNTIKALAFTQSQIYMFKQSNGEPHYYKLGGRTLRGRSRVLIITPKVNEKTIEAFGYSPGGMELHLTRDFYQPQVFEWSSRVLPYEILSVPYSYNYYYLENPYISTITLALLEDSGWYYPKYELAQVPNIGTEYGEVFIKNVPSKVCSFRYYDFYITSFLQLSTSIPSEICPPVMNYKGFVMQGGITGGMEGTMPLAEDCNIPFTSINCLDSYWQNYTSFPFEKLGFNSRCFTFGGPSFSIYFSACLEVISNKNCMPKFRFNERILICLYGGQKIFIPEYDFYIRCPDISMSCKDTSCLNMCGGYGHCRNGLCNCFDGYSGGECEIKCETSCKKCKEVSSECTECYPGYTLIGTDCLLTVPNSKTLICNQGKYLFGNQCLSCHPECLTCTSLEECTSCIPNYYLIEKNCKKCQLGFFEYEGNCETCSNNCEICPNEFSCEKCSPGYMIGINDDCVPECSEGCYNCAGTYCYGCILGYYLKGGSCFKCSPECLGCFVWEDQYEICYYCKDGKKNQLEYSDKSCCKKGCLQCNSNGCLKCENELILINGECKPSPFIGYLIE